MRRLGGRTHPRPGTTRTEHLMQKTFSTPNPVSLYVEVGSGGVTLHTDETDQTSVDVNGRNADAVIVEQRGDEIVVIARQGRGGFFGASGDPDGAVSPPPLHRGSP